MPNVRGLLSSDQGHRMLRFQCRDGNRIIRARCVLVEARSGGARRVTQAPLIYSERGYVARHGRREALGAVVEADPGVETQPFPTEGGPKRTMRDTA